MTEKKDGPVVLDLKAWDAASVGDVAEAAFEAGKRVGHDEGFEEANKAVRERLVPALEAIAPHLAPAVFARIADGLVALATATAARAVPMVSEIVRDEHGQIKAVIERPVTPSDLAGTGGGQA